MRMIVALGLALAGAAPAMAGCKVGMIAELPVTMEGRRPIVPAQINGQDARFLLDSGAFWSLMAVASADRYGVRRVPAPPGFMLRGIGGSAEVTIGTIHTLTLAGQPVRDVQFLVGGSDTGNAGIIGQNFLGIGDVDYDLAHGVVRLMQARGCGNFDMAYWAKGMAYAVIPIESMGPFQRHTIGTIAINGHAVRAVFDTGAASSVLNLPVAARAGLRPDSPGVRPAGLSSGIGRRMIQSWIAPIDLLKIGGEEIRHINLRIADLGPDTDMLVGADFFLAHHIYVANSQRKMFLTYNGGPVFDLSVKAGAQMAAATAAAAAETQPGSAPSGPAPSQSEPGDAEGFSRRGAASMARLDYADALADFDRAVTLAPREPRYLFQRAQAHMRLRRPALARADLDAVLALKPDDVPALLTSAEMRLHAGRLELARRDLDAAAAAMPSGANEQLDLGSLYAAMDAFDPAIAQFSLWLDSHRVDAHRADALRSRCRARALAGRELDRALDDCNTALHLLPKAAGTLDSRGFVHLRRGEDDKALADYQAALAINPTMAWALYGKGLIERRRGETAEGDADIAAAAALAPDLPTRMKRYGLAP